MSTPKEIRETLFRKLDELYGDRTCHEELLRSDRKVHMKEVDNPNAEMSVKDRKLTEKEVRIAILEKEQSQIKEKYQR